MSRYRFGVRRRTDVAPPAAESEAEVSYRDLQALAKERDIPANQSREELESALAEVSSDE